MSKLDIEKGGLNVWMQPGGLPCVISVGENDEDVIEVHVEKVTSYFVKLRIKADPDKIFVTSPKRLMMTLNPNASVEETPNDA